MPIRISANHETVSRLFSLPAALADETLLRVGPDGLTMGLRDPAGARIGWFRATPEAFDTYEFTPSRQPTEENPDVTEEYGINLEKLNEFVKKTKKVGDAKKTIDIELPDKSGKMVLRSERTKVGLALVDIRAMQGYFRKMPNIESQAEYRAVCVVRGKDFKAFTESAATLVSAVGIETVDFVTREGNLYCTAQGDVDDAEILVGDVVGYLDPETNERRDANGCRSVFGLKLITEMCEALPEREVAFKVGHDLPLIAHYADEGMEITGIVAPRMD